MGYIEDLRKLVGHRRLILCGSSVVIRNEKGELRKIDGEALIRKLKEETGK